jgi:hypothetical protein
MATFEIKRNDRRPRFRVQLTANGVPVDLTTASAARIIMKSGSTVKLNKVSMTFIDRAAGIVEYAWAAADTSTSGSYNVEVEIDWGSSDFQTFPTTGYFIVTINDDLA